MDYMPEDTRLDKVDEERVKALEEHYKRLERRLEALYRFLGLREKL